MKWTTRDGVAVLDPIATSLELDLFTRFNSGLHDAYTYLSVPSLVQRSTIERQGAIPWDWTLKVVGDQALSGSAEQGILEHFADQEVAPKRYWAHNQCFRNEDHYEGWLRLREFRKTELFSFCHEKQWETEFEALLSTATRFLKELDLTYRVVDKTKDDPGYHVQKYDVEVLTKTYGWIETHSCSYFGEEQSRRFGITGATHTLSNTGLASPRILIPLLENRP